MTGETLQQTEGSRGERRALQRVPSVQAIAIGDEAVLWAPRDGSVVRLNRSAAAIWDLCDGRRRVTEIAQALGERFGCDAEELVADVRSTLTSLAEKDLLEPAEEPAEGSPTELHVSFDGYVVSITAPEATPLEEAALRYRHLLVSSPVRAVRRIAMRVVDGGWRFFEVAEDGEEVESLGWSLTELEHVVADAFVRARSDLLWTHAAAASNSAGALLLCGESGRGKSALVAGLVDAGWAYLSDESVPIDLRLLTAYPFPTTPQVRAEGLAAVPPSRLHLIPRRNVELDRAKVCDRPTALRAVVFPEFSASSEARLEPCPPAAAIIQLIASCQNFHGQESRMLTGLARLAERLPAFRLVYGRRDAALGLLGRAAAVDWIGFDPRLG